MGGGGGGGGGGGVNEQKGAWGGTGWPLILKFDRATQPFLKFDRRHWTLLKSTEKKKYSDKGH